jgi:hypothetical protein
MKALSPFFYLLLLFATATVYSVMVVWSLPYVASEAGGLLPFDLRPAGYSPMEARTFLDALSYDGTVFYRRVQLTLDLIFPVLFATTIAISMWALSSENWGRWRYAFVIIAVATAAFDYLENSSISAMLYAGPDGLSEKLAKVASNWTVLKSASSTLAITALLVLLALRLFRRAKSA